MASNGPDSPEPVWKLGPISIKRTADIIALVAFVLSVAGLLAQVRDYVRGAHIVLFAPEQVTFGSTKALKVYFQGNDQFLIVTAVMSYVNDAPAGFNGAIAREYVRLTINGKKYQYAAHQSVSTSSETSQLTVVKKEDSGPFAMAAGSAVSHEILFEPHPVRCTDGDTECSGSLSGLSWKNFLDGVKQDQTIGVTLLADVYGGGTLSIRCLIALNASDLKALEMADQQWAAPNCTEVKKKSFWNFFGGKA